MTHSDVHVLTWDGVLRGLVAEAVEVRGDAHQLAVASQRIVDEWTRWPVTATLLAREWAKEILDARQRRLDAAVLLLRESYPGRAP